MFFIISDDQDHEKQNTRHLFTRLNHTECLGVVGFDKVLCYAPEGIGFV